MKIIDDLISSLGEDSVVRGGIFLRLLDDGNQQELRAVIYLPRRTPKSRNSERSRQTKGQVGVRANQVCSIGQAP